MFVPVLEEPDPSCEGLGSSTFRAGPQGIRVQDEADPARIISAGYSSAP